MLTAISIHNFRSFSSATVDLNESVVALVGKNGAGKTSVLHSIQIAANLCTGRYVDAFRLRPREPNSPCQFTLDFEIGDKKYRYKYVGNGAAYQANGNIVSEELSKDGAIVFCREGENVQLQMEADSPTARIGLGAPTLPTLMQILPSDSVTLREIENPNRYLSGVKYYALPHLLQEHRFTQRAEDMLSEPIIIEQSFYDTWKSRKSSKYTTDSVLLRLLDMHLNDPDKLYEIKHLLGPNGLDVIQDIRIEEPVMPADASDGPNPSLRKFYFVTFIPGTQLAGAGKSFLAVDLSVGTWRVIQLITHIVYDSHSCILIEQPEDSIHPGLLSGVIDILSSYSDRTQVICTTHSTKLLNHFGGEGLRFVVSEGGQTVVSKLTEDQVEASSRFSRDSGTLSEYLETL